MTRRTQSGLLLRNRNARRLRMLLKMAAMRAAKERRRLENPVESEPRMERWFPLQLGLRDKVTGDVAWVDLRSLRDALRRLRIVFRWYTPWRFSPSTINHQPSTNS